MSMMYCPDCDRMIDTDNFEFEDICMECHLKLTSKQEDLILGREE